MIELKNVTKQYPNKLAVNGISFKAEKGEIIGFLGPNGAGKTTTMRLIMGVLNPTDGTVRVSKKTPTIDRTDIVKNIGYLPENNPLYGDMKVNEYLSFIAEVRGVEVPEELAEAVSIDDVMDRKIEELSRGYRQRVGLAAALIGDPDILILDEPTSGLDPIEQDKIKELIHKQAENKIIIFSTHILSEVEDVATRLIIIYQGRIIYDGKKPSGKGAVETLFKKLIKEQG
jgi:ABC-2 type transport system ATP-binding protein